MGASWIVPSFLSLVRDRVSSKDEDASFDGVGHLKGLLFANPFSEPAIKAQVLVD